MEIYDFDVIIAGAGPSGCSTALSLANSELKIALIDKAIFPREKICGDGLTVDTQNQLKKLSPRLFEKIQSYQKRKIIQGCLITSTKGYKNYFEFSKGHQPYIIERALFDNELLMECKRHENIHVLEDTLLNDCIITDDDVTVTSSKGTFKSKMIVGADGVNSVIAKIINPNKAKQTLFGSSLRAYYSNVKDIEYQDAFEIHFLKDLIPGYFWIFPMFNNTYNVGIGMNNKIMKKRGIKLSDMFNDIVNNDPRFKERFKDANLEGGIKAFRIPAFNRYKKIYGKRVLLVGDSANIVDPLSGEGIANALRTGRFAGDHIKKCFAANNFSKDFNKSYYKRIKKVMFPELNRNFILAIFTSNEFFSNLALKNNSWLNKLMKSLAKRFI
ncbi:MAG: hypothetical protein C0595_05605 [Marinilabiliales bacterium]|nr:MAG: hypothetical protein C0595_05605 [Marinilabiliales bacterium]